MEFNKRYNRTEFVDFLQHKFLPEDFVVETTSIDIERQTKYIRAITKLGSSEMLDLVVYEVRHHSTQDARVGLSKEAFRFLADEWESRALVLFVPENNDANYRFSLITIDLNETEKGRLQRIYSNPRRYSYYLGEGIAYYTPNKYLNNLGRVTSEKDLTERFSVEVLTKAFYQELSDWYAWAVKIIRFPNKLDDKNDDDKYNAEAAIRLVTRLIFVWFLKQKQLIPEEFFDEDYIRENLIEDFNPNTKVDLFYKSYESKYYKAILQNLFFAMLNSPITKEGDSELSERHFRSGRGDYDNNKLMRYETMFKNPQLFIDLANRTVPFLNGGLFDCLDDKDNKNYVDGFSDREEVKKSLVVPDYLFFGEEVGKNIDLSEWYGDKKKKRVSASGIIDILKRYNFTVEENTPFDQEVSLDPELLGKVFENLLASYNPETQSTARKQTGSFYTPRDIVQYMVDESLVAHLKRIVGEELEEEYRKLISYVDEEDLLTDAQKQQVMEAIYHCKILDPACGSGAFPVGMLQQMVHILSKLDPTNEQWKKMMLDKAVSESRTAFQAESKEEREERLKDIENSFDENLNNPDYARKLYLIENCIYGVDIQPIAIQISKLRFFISLVVDQKTTTNPADNFGIRPLPNLEAKFVAANSLIPLVKTENNLGRTPEIIAVENKLKEVNHKIFGAKTIRTKRKWRERLIELRAEMAEKLANNGFLTTDAANQLASWDMFNQNTFASFFDAEWMFGIKEGFDVVIGNPPYLRIQGIRNTQPQFADYLVKTYKSATGKFDLYVTFVEKGLSLCASGGLLNFIMPTKWTNSDYGIGVRGIVLKEKLQIRIINFSSFQVFNASTYTGLQWFVKSETRQLEYLQLGKDITTPEELRLFLQGIKPSSYMVYPFSRFSSKTWKLSSDKNTSFLLEKFANMPKLRDVLEYISQGTVSTGDDIFIMKGRFDDKYFIGYSEEIKKEVVIEKELMKPILKGEDVKRYAQISNSHYILYAHHTVKGKTVPYTEKEMMDYFPKAYAYLLPFKEKLIAKKVRYKTNPTYWYSLHRSREISMFENRKIITPEISLGCNMTLDNEGLYHNTQCYTLSPKIGYQKYILSLLGILNSKLFWFFLSNTGTILRGDFFRFKTKYIEGFPISEFQEMQIASLESLVKKVLSATNSGEQVRISAQIDVLVYHLYNLTYDEVCIVDPETSITREEYEQ